MKRREFVKYIGCGCCSFSLASCSSAPITNRKQITFYPESVINNKAAQAYEKFKKKAKISKDTETLKLIKSIGSKMEVAISSYFKMKNIKDPTENFKWEYTLVDDDKMLNAWCTRH